MSINALIIVGAALLGITIVTVAIWLLCQKVMDESNAIDKEWAYWQKHEKPKGIRFGQYWCNKMNIHDPILFYMENNIAAKAYIEDELDDDIN